MMKFERLGQKLSDLEKINSRNRMTELLAELVKEVEVDEADVVAYLILGRLRPLYDSLEFGLAEKQVQKAIARVVGKDLEEIVKVYKKKGDLGEVVEDLHMSGLSKLTVIEVHKILEKIANESGQGSQERKLSGLVSLLSGLDGLSAKYVVRIVLGKLRLGFSDKTLLDAVSWAYRGDKSAKLKLERAYQMHPDIGWLVKSVKESGIDEVSDKVKMELGIPISPMLCQRLKSSEAMIKKMGRVAVEPKFDGTRVQIHFLRDGKDWTVRTFTRNLEETSEMFPELKEMALHVKADELVLDSEAVGVDPKTGKMMSFQMTITRKRKHGVANQAGIVPLKFFVFDVMYLDGKSLINEAYEERRAVLKDVVKDKDLLVVDDYWETDDPKMIRQMHERLLSEGLEGVIVKKLGSEYIPGRTGWRWVKMKEVEESHAKLADTIDCVVMGYYRGRGKRAQFGIGAFLVGIKGKDGYVTVTKVGTGLTDELFRELKTRLDRLVTREQPKEYEIDKALEPDVYVEPELVVELAADEVTESPSHTAGLALRFPRLVKLRGDKSVDQITSLKELEEMRV